MSTKYRYGKRLTRLMAAISHTPGILQAYSRHTPGILMSKLRSSLEGGWSMALLLLLILGNGHVWGQTLEEGFYCIASGEGYSASNSTVNYYMVPAQDYLNGDSEKPFVTTYKTNQSYSSLWKVVKSGSDYQLIHEEDGKYLMKNGAVISGKPNRKSIHLETKDGNSETGADLFEITKNGNAYNIRIKSINDGYLNPAGGNKDSYTPITSISDGAGGMVGYYGSTDGGSKWRFEPVTPECAKPTFTKKSDGKIEISCTTRGVTIYYTTDGSTPSASSAEYSGAVSITDGTVLQAIAIKEYYTNSKVASYYTMKTVHSSSEIGMTGNYLLAPDFNFTGTIGTAESPFCGIIDGGFNTFDISITMIECAEGATIKNIIVNNTSANGSGNVGALVNTAKGDTKIYNCGVLGGSVSGGTNVGGLVGLVEAGSQVRVVNCFSYANVSGSDYAAGIVGKNEGTVGDVRIAMCMMYGNVSGATNISPVYAGNHISNVRNFTEYNYYLYSNEKDAQGNRIEKIPYTAYNDQMAIDKEDYLTRFPFYRHILNTHRELAAYFLFDDADDENHEIGHWVLKKDVAPYPIIEKWQTNTKKTTEDIKNNLPNTTEKGAGKLLDNIGNDGYYTGYGTKVTTMGTSGYLKVNVTINGTSCGSVDLPITDMDEANYDYTWGKVVLPFANEFSGWTRDYSKICTGWEITSVSGGTAGSFSNYDVTDRNCTAKDLYSNSGYIFAQGGNYIVPYGVTTINITAHFANAFYLSDQTYDMGYDDNYANATLLGDAVRSSYHERYVYTDLATLVNALATTKNPHDQAIVLVGNFHYNMKALGGTCLNKDKAVTIMSVDEDCNQEPDYGWYSYMNDARPTVPPLRFDFLPNIPMGMSSHVTGSKNFPGVSIWKTRGWFEFTETCVSIMHQCEIDSGDFTEDDNGKGNNRWIANSGYFTQIVRSYNKECTKLSYIQIGGNAYVKELYPGNHSTKNFTNKAVPINVTGGEIEECFMTGYHVGGSLYGDIHFWCGGGKIHKFLGAYMEKPREIASKEGGTVNMTAQIDHARILRFFGGGTSGAARITGDINVTINNSLVDSTAEVLNLVIW